MQIKNLEKENLGSLVIKLYIEDDNYKWVDFTDFCKFDKLVDYPSIQFKSTPKGLSAVFSSSSGTVKLFNTDGVFDSNIFDLKTEDGLDAVFSETYKKSELVWKNRRIRFYIEYFYQNKIYRDVAGTFIIDDITTGSSDYAELSYTGLEQLLIRQDASTVKNGMECYRNRRINFLVKKILEKQFGNRNYGKIPTTFDIDGDLSIESPDGNPLISFLGQPPVEIDDDGDGNPDFYNEKVRNPNVVIKAKSYIGLDKDNPDLLNDPDCIMIGIDNILVKYEPDKDLYTELDNSTFSTDYEIKYLWMHNLYSYSNIIYGIAVKKLLKTVTYNNIYSEWESTDASIFQYTTTGGIEIIKNLYNFYDGTYFYHHGEQIQPVGDDGVEDDLLAKHVIRYRIVSSSKNIRASDRGNFKGMNAYVPYEQYLRGYENLDYLPDSGRDDDDTFSAKITIVRQKSVDEPQKDGTLSTHNIDLPIKANDYVGLFGYYKRNINLLDYQSGGANPTYDGVPKTNPTPLGVRINYKTNGNVQFIENFKISSQLETPVIFFGEVNVRYPYAYSNMVDYKVKYYDIINDKMYTLYLKPEVNINPPVASCTVDNVYYCMFGVYSYKTPTSPSSILSNSNIGASSPLFISSVLKKVQTGTSFVDEPLLKRGSIYHTDVYGFPLCIAENPYSNNPTPIVSAHFKADKSQYMIMGVPNFRDYGILYPKGSCFSSFIPSNFVKSNNPQYLYFILEAEGRIARLDLPTMKYTIVAGGDEIGENAYFSATSYGSLINYGYNATGDENDDILYGISTNNPEGHLGNTDFRKYFFFRYSKYLSDYITYADFDGLDAWEALSLLAQRANCVMGFNEYGNFYFKKREYDDTDTDDLDVLDLDAHDYKSFNKGRGQGNFYNYVEVIPYVLKENLPSFEYFFQERKSDEEATLITEDEIKLKQINYISMEITLVCSKGGNVNVLNSLGIDFKTRRALFKYSISTPVIEAKISRDYTNATKIILTSVFGGQDTEYGIKPNYYLMWEDENNESVYIKILAVDGAINEITLQSGITCNVNDTVKIYRNVQIFNDYDNTENIWSNEGITTVLGGSTSSIIYVNDISQINLPDVLEINGERTGIRSIDTNNNKIVLENELSADPTIGDVVGSYLAPLANNVYYNIGGSNLYINFATLEDSQTIFKVGDKIKITAGTPELSSDESSKQIKMNLQSINLYEKIQYPSLNNRFINRKIGKGFCNIIVHRYAYPRYSIDIELPLYTFLKINERNRNRTRIILKSTEYLKKKLGCMAVCVIDSIKHNYKSRTTTLNLTDVSNY